MGTGGAFVSDLSLCTKASRNVNGYSIAFNTSTDSFSYIIKKKKKYIMSDGRVNNLKQEQEQEEERYR